MTLLDYLPSLHNAATPRIDPAIWPLTTTVDELGRLCVGKVPLTDIADEFRTPTYVLDESDFRRRLQGYRTVLRDVEVLYAAKALLTANVARWVAEEGAGLDVSSAGELAIALAGGVDPARIVLHGNAKPVDEVRDATAVGIGRIVIDSAMEIAYLACTARRPQPVLIRVTPDIDICGHAAVTTGFNDQRFPRPRIVVEPVRAISARAGVTLYRVVSVKSQPGGRTFVAVDGGMSDNPRVALYGAKYTVALANRHALGPTKLVTIAGRHCESGDEIARDVELPADVHPGDLLAVACAGAYQHSMASNYNMVGRPPIVAVRHGTATELVRRETTADLLARDRGWSGGAGRHD
jgi:diaminopimelate decarboxylase